jgi:hypothetical protein
LRALHRLAWQFRCTVEELIPRLSAQAFTRWLIWMEAERIGPDHDRLRHAQMLAAGLNAGHVKKKDGTVFAPNDFLPDDPWAEPKAPPPAPTFEQIAAQAAAMFHGAP